MTALEVGSSVGILLSAATESDFVMRAGAGC